MDIEKLKKDYENLVNRSYTRLLPFQKIVALEQAKDDLINRFLIYVKSIDSDFKITSDNGITLEHLIEAAKENFGDVNFLDKTDEDGRRTIDIAFHFCILSLNFINQKLKYKITVFWDV